ncbi:hypothetical protein V1478_003805 [Vespula squamosa]|uniref:Uncharacterized protein n=1 Tax=Vespula squamosa TaxID=30214 RepID=A0ABD2BMX8_VESSQ
MPFLEAVTKSGRKYYKFWRIHSDARADNKVGPLTDFDDYNFSFGLTFDECTSQLPRDAFIASRKEAGMQIAIVHWRSFPTRDDTAIELMVDFDFNFEKFWRIHSDARADNKVGPLTDFDDYNFSFGLTFDECTSQLPWDAFIASRKEAGMQIAIVHWRSFPTRDDTAIELMVDFDFNFEKFWRIHSDARADNKVGPLTDFDDYNFSFGLTFDECTSQLPWDAFIASRKEAGMQIAIVHWRSFPTRDDTAIELMVDFDFNFEKFWRIHSDARADNKVGPLTDFDDYNFSFGLTFDECTSQLPRDAFIASRKVAGMQVYCSMTYFFYFLCNLFCFRLQLCTGGPFQRVTIPQSNLWSILTLISWSGLRNFRGMPFLQLKFSRIHSDARADNKVAPLTDFDDYNFSFGLTFDECTSQLPRDAIIASRKVAGMQVYCSVTYFFYFLCNLFCFRLQLCTGGPFQRVTIPQSNLWSILTLISWSGLRNFRGMPFLQAVTKSGRKYYKFSRIYSDARADNKVGPLTNFDDYNFSFGLTFDECTSQLPRDAIIASRNEEGTQKYSRIHSDARADSKVGPLTDFDDYNFSFGLTFDECTSQLPRDVFIASRKVAGMQIAIVHWRSFPTRDDTAIELMKFSRIHSAARADNKVGPLTDFDGYNFSFGLTFDECTSQLPRDAFIASRKVAGMQVYCSMTYFFYFLCNLFCFRLQLCTGGPFQRVTIPQSNLWSILTLISWSGLRNFRGMPFLQLKFSRIHSDARADNKVAPLTDFDGYNFSFGLTFDECTSQLPRDAFIASRKVAGMQVYCSVTYFFYFLCNLFCFRLQLCTGGPFQRVTIPQSNLWSILTLISWSGLRNFRGMPFLQLVTKSGRKLQLCTGGPFQRVTIPQSNLWSILTLISWSELRNFSRDAIPAISNEELQLCTGGPFQRVTIPQSNLWSILTLISRSGLRHFRGMPFLQAVTKSGRKYYIQNFADTFGSTRRQQSGPLTDFDHYNFNFGLTLDECTSQLPRDVFIASRNLELCTCGPPLHVTIPQSKL